jgi:uncharacterized protein YbaR (Trm112 family)
VISTEFLDILRCPENRTRLRPAGAELLERLNGLVAAGKLVNKAGQPVAKPLEAGLVREDGAVFYLITDDIPILLIDEGIDLGALPQ